MKPILINLNEMSDSREVYESKPNIALTLFIYVILALLLAGLTWMYFGRIDVVVKSEGMLRPNNQVATVVNNYGGTLEQVKVEDGARVKKGDVLYVIKHQDLVSECSYYQSQMSNTKNMLDLLGFYKQSIDSGVNCFPKSDWEEEYYLKYRTYVMNYKKLKREGKSAKDQLKTLQSRLANTRKLKEAISSNQNLFAAANEDKEYNNLYLKYQSDYQALVTQYDKAKEEIDHSTTQEGLVNSLDYYNNMLDGLKKLKSSVKNSKSVFEDTSSYSLQYKEYVNKLADLKTAYEQAGEDYKINKELVGLAVTELELNQSESAMEAAGRTLDNYKSDFMNSIISNITDTQNKIKELQLSKKGTASKTELYQQNKTDKAAALTNYKLKYMVDLDNTIATLKDNITSLENNSDGLFTDGNLQQSDDKDIQESLEQYKNNELQSILTDTQTYSDKEKELQANIDKLNIQISEAVVKATRSGVVNNNIELVPGDTLASGTEVLTIIPENNSDYKANIYVNNRDIGKLRKGMKVKFNVYALPQSEYGYLTGTITRISRDLKVDSSSGSGYYLVEAKVNNKVMFDSQGKKGMLKPGMTCQAQMITERKRILRYVLEKINLWIKN